MRPPGQQGEIRSPEGTSLGRMSAPQLAGAQEAQGVSGRSLLSHSPSPVAWEHPQALWGWTGSILKRLEQVAASGWEQSMGAPR